MPTRVGPGSWVRGPEDSDGPDESRFPRRSSHTETGTLTHTERHRRDRRPQNDIGSLEQKRFSSKRQTGTLELTRPTALGSSW